MELSRKAFRTSKVALFIALLVFGVRAVAQVSVLSLCEAGLSDSLKSYSTDRGSLLSDLRGLRFQVETRISDKASESISYQEIQFAGRFQRLKPKTAVQISEQIAGIEDAIGNAWTRQDPDVQMVARAIRGKEAIVRARDEFVTGFDRAVALYLESEKRLQSEKSDIAERRTKIKRLHYGILIGLNLLSYAASQAGVPVVDPVLWWAHHIYNILSLSGFFVSRERLYDRSPFESAMKTLNDFLSHRPDPNRLFVGSTYSMVPTELHKWLFSGEEDDLENSRLDAYMINSSVFNLIAETIPPPTAAQMKKAVSLAGDIYRYIFFDQFMYFDRETNEPVWIMVYRAYRTKPVSRRPPRKREVGERDQAFAEEGAIQPVR